MHPIYSLDNTINTFFESQSTVTRRQCDELAVSLVGEPANPAPIQGAFSYTVIAGVKQSKVVQFRAQSSVLDIETLDLARAIHGQFVAACTYHGNIGQSSLLSVYVIEKLPETTYIQARCINGLFIEPSLEATSRQSNTVITFARYVELWTTSYWANSMNGFFAASWTHRQTKPIDVVEAIHHDYQQKLDLLSQALPSRFTENFRKVRAELPLLFASTYPLVLSHDDLCEMNIFMDPNTGHLMGIIEWAEAKIIPFGISLWGFENMLGYMDSQGWHYYSNRHKLENLFWRIFEETVGGVSEAHMQGWLASSCDMDSSGRMELEKYLRRSQIRL